MAYSVTEAAIGWLASLGYAAHNDVPAMHPASFTTVSPTASAVADMIPTTELAIQFWGPTEAECEAAALACRDAMLTGERPAGVHSVEIAGGPYPFPDPESRARRWQMTVRITHSF